MEIKKKKSKFCRFQTFAPVENNVISNVHSLDWNLYT